MAAPASERIALQWHDFYLALLPAAGGSVAAFTWRDQPLFRTEMPTPESPAEPLALAGFPLIPFASRITGNRFAWSSRRDGVLDRDILLTPNMPGEPLAIHGQSWRHPWTAENTAAGGYRLTYHHEPDSWPWRYRARQTFTPHPDGFSLALELANTDRTPMPGGLGWHPYLHRGDARLTASVAGRIRGTGDPPGGRRLPHPGFVSARVDQLNLDHGFYDWQGLVDVHWPARGLHLTMTAASPLDHLIVYTPPAAPYFCVEPVSHLPDAANWRDPYPNGWRTVEPGESLRATISISVRAEQGID